MQIQSNNEFAEFLKKCGVTETTIGVTQKDSLDHKGYAVLASIIDSKQVDRLRNAFETAFALQHSQSSGNQSGTRHIKDPLDADITFEIAFTHAAVLAAVYHILKCPFKLSQFGCRDPLPGYGQQGLHTDWMQRSPGEPFRVVTAIWLLDDFTSNNGATRLIPGTHLQIKPVPKTMSAPANRHPDQVIMTAPAGSILVFNGHLWHSGTRNDSKNPRRTLQCSFYSREIMGSGTVTCGTPERLTPTGKYLLGI